MNKSLKQFLLASAGAMALVAGVSVGSANAFDRSHWTFRLDIDPCVFIDVDLDPSSMTTVEADQLSVGDIKAISVVKDVDVDLPGDSHHHDWWDDHHDHDRGLDALTQLGLLVSTATAVANNVNVQTDTEALFADITQTAQGSGIIELCLPYLTSTGEVRAISVVKDIENLQVDSSATAVSNNVNLASTVAHLHDTSVVANVTQNSYMDVTAKSIVKDIDIDNFKNLGSLTSPVISSVATAVGNNLNVSVTKGITVTPTP
jgi:hypothetical protein